MRAARSALRLEARASQVGLIGLRLAVEAAGVAPERREPATLYLLVTACNVPGALAAEIVGCSKQNVSQVLSRVEDRREDPDFDAVLDRLERMILGE